MNLLQILDSAYQELSKTPSEDSVAIFGNNDFFENYKKSSKDLHSLPEYLRIGNITNDILTYPALFPLKGIKGMAFQLDDTNRDELNQTIENLALQLCEQMNDRYYELLAFDPRKLGNNFKNIRKMCKPIVEESEIRNKVDKLFSDSVTTMNECLSNYSSIDEYNKATGENCPYRIVLIADFPYGFRECINKMATIIDNASEAGLLFLVTFDPSLSTSSSAEKEMAKSFINQMVIFKETDEQKDIYSVENIQNAEFYNSDFSLKLDRSEISFEKIKSGVDQIISSDKKELSHSYVDGLRIPLGKAAGKEQFLTLGHETDNYHGIIGGQPGKGKTTVLNNIIVNGIRKYSADELNYVLIDCAGVGFQEYRDCPQVIELCSSSNADNCVNSIKFIENILIERERLFKENCVTELRDYVKKTGEPMPRILCLIDEFHVLFTGSRLNSSYIETVLVDRVIRIGRKFGVHLIVSTQSLGGGVRRSFLDNIPLRMALGMTEDQSLSFLGVKNDAAANLERGLLVYNSENGSPSANKLVRIPFIRPEDIKDLIHK